MNTLQQFYSWCQALKIVSKEKGLTSFSPSTWFSGQKYLIKHILSEIEANSSTRDFIILKARQLGVTTVLLALDLFWLFKHNAIRIAFLCQSYETRPKLRSTFRTLYVSLPKTHKLPAITDNREMMHFSNHSEILYYHVSPREASRESIARSQAVTCIHATEAAFYDSSDPNEEILKSLQMSRAKYHPARYTILESTANGFNSFYDRWMAAKDSPDVKRIFVGWWSRDDYRISQDNPIFEAYGYPPDHSERKKMETVKRLYNVTIDIEQLAWWRRELVNTFSGDENFAYAELPWTEYDAFRLTGFKFFDSTVLSDMRCEIDKEPVPLYLNLYSDANGVYVYEGQKRRHNFQIYELPSGGETYFIGADPTFGSSPDSDNAVISVWKGYKDKIVQVAEYSDNSIGPIEFAKLVVFISCFYRPSYLSLEVTGPGRVVIKELDKIKTGTFSLGEVKVEIKGDNINATEIQKFTKDIRDYLYYRPDSLRRSFARHWETNQTTKEPLMNQMRSVVHLGMCKARSKELIEEMNYFVKDGTTLGAIGSRTDDRVIAAALAIEYWRTWFCHRLPTYEDAQERKDHKTDVIDKLGLYEVLKPFARRA